MSQHSPAGPEPNQLEAPVYLDQLRGARRLCWSDQELASPGLSRGRGEYLAENGDENMRFIGKCISKKNEKLSIQVLKH